MIVFVIMLGILVMAAGLAWLPTDTHGDERTWEDEQHDR